MGRAARGAHTTDDHAPAAGNGPSEAGWSSTELLAHIAALKGESGPPSAVRRPATRAGAAMAQCGMHAQCGLIRGAERAPPE